MNLSDDVFAVTRKIRFAELDPAGIVFYPEYFRMFNDLFEDWIEQAIGVDFPLQFSKHQRMFPMVHGEIDFKQPRVMGQRLKLAFVLTGLGRSTIRYSIVGNDGDENGGSEILRGQFVTCMASKTSGKSLALPDDMRAAMEAYLKICEGIVE
jgi:4-hydroxybenzoyl-CoA thioesterase